MGTKVVCLITLYVCIYVSIQSITCKAQSNYDIEEAKIKLSRLESIVEETIQKLNDKSRYLSDSQNRIEDMTFQIERLQSELSSLKGEASDAHQKLHQLEEEVRLLWATLRKSNFEIHLLEAKAHDADDRLESVTSQVETMAAIITEQWIQIQRLEQALYIAQTTASKAKRAAMFARCSFLKWVGNLFGIEGTTKEKSIVGIYLSQALHDLDMILSAVRKYHHKLQGFIKHGLERNEYTAPLANKEVVFFVVFVHSEFSLPIFKNLTRLELGLISSLTSRLLSDLLDKSPRLESIEFTQGEWDEEHRDDDDDYSLPEHVPACVALHIKEVEFEFAGSGYECKMIRYFLKHAKNLKVMKIRNGPGWNEQCEISSAACQIVLEP